MLSPNRPHDPGHARSRWRHGTCVAICHRKSRHGRITCNSWAKSSMLQTQPAPHEVAQQRSRFNRIPSSTYRLQLSKSLDFASAEKAISYLDELGITDL